MKKQNDSRAAKTERANPLMNAAVAAVVSLAIVPAVLFGAIRFVQSSADSAAKSIEVKKASSKRSSAAERRARRLESRKAKEAKTEVFYPEITLETVEPYYDGFGTEYDAGPYYNDFGMMPPAYMGAPVMMPPPYAGAPGMMPPAYGGAFNGFR